MNIFSHDSMLPLCGWLQPCLYLRSLLSTSKKTCWKNTREGIIFDRANYMISYVQLYNPAVTALSFTVKTALEDRFCLLKLLEQICTVRM